MAESDDAQYSLPTPIDIWGYGAVIGLLYSVDVQTPEEVRIDADGMHVRHLGGNWWWSLTFMSGGRAVVVGGDVDFSETMDYDVDLLAGAPEWFPREWFDRVGDMAGFLYWWDGTSWDRAPYPPGFTADGENLHRAADIIHMLSEDSESELSEDSEAAVGELTEHVAARSLDATTLQTLLGRIGPESIASGEYKLSPAELTAVLHIAELAGLLTGSTLPEL
ncbi:hypothetical protein [Nocardia sp. NPDC056100]|uniref:hypothetical protein n=1 Tax=Nocardia sp. NPDC056100 TaxID=3345712 RepID=UPI0035D70503